MRPPGTLLRAVAARLFAANTMDYLIDPAIADRARRSVERMVKLKT